MSDDKLSQKILLCEKVLAVLKSRSKDEIVTDQFCGKVPGTYCTFGALGKSVGMPDRWMDPFGFGQETLSSILRNAGLDPVATIDLANKIILANDGSIGDESQPWDRVYEFVNAELKRLREVQAWWDNEEFRMKC